MILLLDTLQYAFVRTDPEVFFVQSVVDNFDLGFLNTQPAYDSFLFIMRNCNDCLASGGDHRYQSSAIYVSPTLIKTIVARNRVHENNIMQRLDNRYGREIGSCV